MAAADLLRRLPRPRLDACTQKGPFTLSRRSIWAAKNPAQSEYWGEKARKIRSGAEPSMLSILEERGYVKTVAGGRDALDWLLTERPIGAYVGVDPTAPSLHVGHLLPLMALYWMYLYGYPTVTLLGGGTVQIGDPSGRTTARARQKGRIQQMHNEAMRQQLEKLWIHVKALGIKHKHSKDVGRARYCLNNAEWLSKLSAIDLMKTLGSGMRLGELLSRDSVRTRMENGDGMALSEFCYPLFQGYDWWHMYGHQGVQLQLGGSDQYGNICAGMDAVGIMRKYHKKPDEDINDPHTATFGLTTPLLTTASGEKFGKSAGNAVWLDPDMLNSFDLYQYFLSTSDADVERYLKLFTFVPLQWIELVMKQQKENPEKRVAQHLLAREVVDLAHGAWAAVEAEKAHKNAFSHGTNTYHLGLLRDVIREEEQAEKGSKENKKPSKTLLYKQEFAAASRGSPTTTGLVGTPLTKERPNITTLPLALLENASFPQVLYAAGLVSSKSEGHRLIKAKGAYVVLPNSGSDERPFHLRWDHIPEAADPNKYLIDFEALVLRSGKSKIRVCRIINTERFEEKGLSFPGWDGLKAKLEESATQQPTEDISTKQPEKNASAHPSKE